MVPAASPIILKIYQPISTSCVFAHVLRTPMRGGTHLKVLLAYPRFVRDIVISRSGYLFDDGTLDFGGTQAESFLLQQPSFDRKLFIHDRNLFDTRPAWTRLNNSSESANHVIDSFLESLKMAARSHGSLCYRSGDVEYEASNEVVYNVPDVFVNLLSCHLPLLVERVSRVRIGFQSLRLNRSLLVRIFPSFRNSHETTCPKLCVANLRYSWWTKLLKKPCSTRS
jgi:hypothetical protein